MDFDATREPAASETLRVSFFSHRGDLLDVREWTGRGAGPIELPLRQIVETALMINAASIALAHTHPSGNPSPSRADLACTRQIAAVLRPIGIALRDHVIHANEGRFSFAEAGLL